MKFRSFFTIFASLLLFDQLSKYIVRQTGGFYICNSDIAFGIKIDPALFYFLWLLIIIFVIILANTKFKARFLPLILILSGALSNIIDRLWHGCVIDFIDLKFWPVFNLADSFIVIGAIMIIIGNFQFKVKIPKIKKFYNF